MFFDLPLEQLVQYRPPRIEPEDFDAFWDATLAEARQHPLDERFEPVDAGLRLVETFDVTFAGFGGQPIKGLLLLLRERNGAPALFSVGLMDDICPPRTVYAAYNHYAGPKQMHRYPYNQHTRAGRQIFW
jgi:cephalosporin-C deacetylase-like acetyl esterase